MITFDTVKVGTRVKNVKAISFYFKQIGTIVEVNEYFFKVEYGPREHQLFHWNDVGPSWFDLVVEYRRATIKDLVPGVKIRANDVNWLSFKTGTLLTIGLSAELQRRKYYDIQWDDGSTDGRTWVCLPEEFIVWFDVLDVRSNGKKRKPKKVIPDIPMDPTLPILEAGYLQDRQRKRFR